mgnify:CR=1 FL=1
MRIHALISGRVQGVWFRESTRKSAEEHGVAGWVRNLSDGRVEVLFEGEPSAVQAVIDFVREGPPHARVTEVEIRDEPTLDAGLTGFRVR